MIQSDGVFWCLTLAYYFVGIYSLLQSFRRGWSSLGSPSFLLGACAAFGICLFGVPYFRCAGPDTGIYRASLAACTTMVLLRFDSALVRCGIVIGSSVPAAWLIVHASCCP